MLGRLFTGHPAAVGETYFQHLAMALTFGFTMITGGVACIIHAIFPFAFEQTGSNTVRDLYGSMMKRRPREQRQGSGGEWVI